jgi:FLVCR family MFS transporter
VLILVLLAAVFIYFPNKPEFPPSQSAAAPRVDLKKGLRQLLRDRNFWHLALAHGIGAGVFMDFGTLLNPIFGPVGITQKAAGYLGFIYSVMGIVASLIMSPIADSYPGNMKVNSMIRWEMKRYRRVPRSGRP